MLKREGFMIMHGERKWQVISTKRLRIDFEKMFVTFLLGFQWNIKQKLRKNRERIRLEFGQNFTKLWPEFDEVIKKKVLIEIEGRFDQKQKNLCWKNQQNFNGKLHETLLSIFKWFLDLFWLSISFETKQFSEPPGLRSHSYLWKFLNKTLLSFRS